MYWLQKPVIKVQSRSINEEVASMEELGCGCEVKHNLTVEHGCVESMRIW
jgi:hypothetical protein